METCSIEGCAGRLYCREMCQRHYLAWWRAQQPETQCQGEGCTNKASAGRRLCGGCHKRFYRTGSTRRITTGERFLSLIQKQQNGCWHWTGYVNPMGYGQWAGKLAHRTAYALWVGPLDHRTIDHTCHTESDCDGGPTCLHRRCVNPDHLELVEAGENVRRGRSVSSHNRQKTHCKHGHEFTPENTGRAKDGSRVCRACRRESARLAREARSKG